MPSSWQTETLPPVQRRGIEDALAGRPRDSGPTSGTAETLWVQYDYGYDRGLRMRGVERFGATQIRRTHDGDPEAFCFEEFGQGRQWLAFPGIPRFVSRVQLTSLDAHPEELQREVGDAIEYWFEGWVEPTAISPGWTIIHYRLFDDFTPRDRKGRAKGQRRGVYTVEAQRVVANLGSIG